MARFKMIHVNAGDEVQVSFVCQHCTVTSQSGTAQLDIPQTEDSHAQGYERPFQQRWRQAGECPRCNGTGFDPAPLPHAKICRACGGTSLCPYCGGNYLRTWAELPLEIQERFLKNWERDGTYPKNYASAPKFFTD